MEAKGSLILPRVAAAPSSPTPGQVYYNTTDNTLYCYNGTTWVAMGGGAATPPTPAGAVMAYAGAAAPSGWLFCDGSLVSRTTYAALFAAIGTLYGAGDGSTTFGLPDFRGDVLVGQAASGTFATLGASGGEAAHTIQLTEMPVHDHSPTSNQLTGSTTPATPTGTVVAATAGTPAGSVSSTFSGNALPNHQHNLTPRTEGAGDAKTDSFTAGTAGTQNLIRRLDNNGGTTGVWVYVLTGLASAGTPSGSVSSSFVGTQLATHGHTFTGNSQGGHTHALIQQGGNTAHNNLQPYQVVNYMIKT